MVFILLKKCTECTNNNIGPKNERQFLRSINTMKICISMCSTSDFYFIWVSLYWYTEPSRGKRTKLETIEWRPKALIPRFYLSPYFCFPDSTLFRFLTVWTSSVRGEPKIQAMTGSALIRISYNTIGSIRIPCNIFCII